MACPGCGARVEAEARFCPNCGVRQRGVQTAEERKRVSIIFVDQVGSTARADGADPEDVRDRNRLYYEEVRGRIERHGGLLEKYAGDAIMAVFGAPLAHSNDAESAVRAGISVLEGVQQLNAEHDGLDLEVRVGICTGEAMVEIDPPPESALATGDVVNTAARLQTAAAPGTVIVGPETHRLTRHVFEYRALPPVDAKGKREPVPAWIVEAVTTRAAASAEPRASLVGRDREMLLLRTVWLQVVEDQQPHLITLIGPAGIGKSRLADEIGGEAVQSGGRFLRGRCSAYEQQTPYHVVAQVMRQASRILESDPVDTARQKLEGFVASLLSENEARDLTRYLALSMGLGLDERAREAVEIQYAIRRLLECVSSDVPLLAVFEDLHWADEASLDLLEYLSTRMHDGRTVIMALARPELLESRPQWGAGVTAHTSVPLNPLSATEANRAAAELLPGADDGILARIVETAEGNPLFIEELAASIHDDAVAYDLPPTIHAVLAARIDALPGDARAALLRASVIGKEFWRGVLGMVSGLPDIDDALDALEMRGLIQRRTHSQVEGEVEFAFKHDLVLDTAYSTLPRASRRELHARTAAALEALADQPEDIAPILAHHWRAGGDAERSRQYLMTAAERARQALAVEETYDLYSQALDLASTDTERVRVRWLRAHALVQLQDYARAADELAQLIPSLRGESEVEALVAQSHALLWTEQTDETMACAGRALELAREGGYRDLETEALGMVAAAHGMCGESGDLEKAVALGDEALGRWAAGARPAEHAEMYHMVSNHLYWYGEYQRAMDASVLSFTTAGVELHSQEFRLRGAGMQAVILAGMGRYEEALAAADHAIALGRDMGRPVNVVVNYSTLPLRDIFALEDALARSEEVAENLGPSTFNMPWMNARADVFVAKVMRGDLSLAERGWSALWDDAVSSSAWERWLVSGRLAAVRAELDLALGRVDDAQKWAQRAIGMAVTSSRSKYEAIGRITLGRTLLAAGLAADAASEIRSALAVAETIGTPSIRWQAQAALGEALAASGADPSEAFREAASIIRSISEALSPPRAATFLDDPHVSEVLDAAR
jgi:class 3 adenylate cyclase/tetratricopeptide (TPR) repeat protein